MLKSAAFYLALTLALMSSALTFADRCCYWGDCCHSFELGVGWRKDTLNWHVRDMESSYISHAKVDSHIRFNDIDMYTINGKLRWVGSYYYVRLYGMYGLSDKGRAKQHFNIEDRCVLSSDSVSVSTSNHIKRRSEFYDFDLGVGYPITFLDCRLAIIPVIGFSYDRQRINVREKHHSSSSSCYCFNDQHRRRRDRRHHRRKEFAANRNDRQNRRDPNPDPNPNPNPDPNRNRRRSSSSSSSSFSVDSSSNPFRDSSLSSNPFSSSSSSENIASALGLSNDKESANYRFSWYGPYAGLDVAYALDSCWTLFTELEGHFLSNVHRKRKSWTGVDFVDEYHHKGWAYGFDGTLGTTFCFCGCWFSTINVDYKWWKGHSKKDSLHWTSVNVNVTIGLTF